MNTDIDLFEHFETLPEELKRILTKYEECDNDYNVMAAMQAECEAIGYTFDYYLDAEPYNLRELKQINMNITINAIELASELAHERLELEWADSIEIYKDEDSSVLTYTEEAQDIFNELYDLYLTKIEECKTN